MIDTNWSGTHFPDGSERGNHPNSPINRLAYSLQAQGPDEFPFGYYRHLAILALERYTPVTIGSTTFYKCSDCTSRTNLLVVAFDDIEDHEDAHALSDSVEEAVRGATD